MMSRLPVVLLAAAISAAPVARAQGPSLVKDINPGLSTTPIQGAHFQRILGTLGGRAFLWGIGTEPPDFGGLWVSDGTTSETRRILGLELSCGPGVEADGWFYFGAIDTVGSALWRSDGTPAGTTLVRRVGPRSSGIEGLFSLTAASGRLFFSAYDDEHGRELWTSDGTETGTRLVRDVAPGPTSSMDDRSEIVALGDKVLFSSYSGSSWTLWRSDGTDAGTVPVAAPYAISSLVNVNGTVYFAAGDDTHGVELWKSDGTPAGTTLVKDVVPGAASSEPMGLVAFGPGVSFSSGTDGSIWTSDGTEGGTVQVYPQKNDYRLLPCNGHLFFTTGSNRIWASDGTTGGTNLLKETGASVGLDTAGCVLGTLLFWVDRNTDKMELWRSDGTPGGTSLVTLVEADVQSDVWSASMSHSVSARGQLFTVFDAGLSNAWASDGTSAGTVPLVAPVRAPNFSLPRALADVNGTLLFSASDADHGRELWRSDGTPEGTVLVKDLESGPGSSGPAPLLVTPSLVLFAACPKATGCELYRTDGTGAGTVLVKDVNPGAGSGFSFMMGRLGDVLIFVANDGAPGWGPYRSDGTPDGTFRLGPPPADTQFVEIDPLGVLKGSLYFRKISPRPTGEVLWKTDGTSEGTVAVAPLSGGYSYGFVLSAALDDAILFSNDDGTNRPSLWKTDGTAAGTSMLASVGPVGSLVRIGSRIFFWAWDDAHGIEPWTTDGTAAGTALLKDVYPGRPGSYSREGTTVLGSSLFFWADDGVHGLELWKTDGTSAGTTLVRDIAQGPASSYAGDRLVSTGREAYFFAADPAYGPELWRTDGSEAGTTRVADLNPGLWGSDVKRNMYWKEPLMSRSGGRMFFTATDGATGYELWSLPIPLGFHSVTPCRVADTRDPGGPAGGVPLGSSQTLILPVTGRCGIPSTAISVAANVTVVNPGASGTLSVFAGGPIVSGTTDVPVTAGRTRGLNAIPSLGTAGSLSVRADLAQGGTTHVLLDVSGYFE